MAVKIRMKRIGAKKKPFYRIVVADSRAPRDGRFIEEIGYYNPISNPKVFKVDAEKAMKWMQTGAKPTETVARLFKVYNVADDAKNVKEEVKAEETKVEETKVEETKVEEEVVAENEEVAQAVEQTEENAEQEAVSTEEIKDEAVKENEEVAQAVEQTEENKEEVATEEVEG